MPSAKHAIASVLDRFGVCSLSRRLQFAWMHPHVRILNYHDVPPSAAAAFERQLASYAERYEPVGVTELRALQAGTWDSARPGLFLTFDDGLRSHADVVAPILERHGFQGCFLVPIGFVDTPPDDQRAWARSHHIQASDEYGDERIALTWDDVRRLDSQHVIGSHTWDHVRLRSELSAEELDREILQARRRMEQELGHEVDIVAWVGGEEWSYSAGAARAIHDAGFRMALMTNNAVVRPGCDLLQLQRTNVEAHFPQSLVELSLSGIYDLSYRAKRRRVNDLTRISGMSPH